MKTIKALALALGVVLAAAGIAATGATAAEWQVNGAALTKAAAVSSESTIKFEHQGGLASYSCAISRKGNVGPGAAGEITSITSPGGAKAIPCTLEGGSECLSNVAIEAVGLPWHTEINAESRNLLTASHEWKVTCKNTVGEVATNWCAVPKSTALVNYGSGVEQTYDSHTELTSCLSSGNAFAMKGSEQLKTSSGLLSISTPGTKVAWRQSGKALSESIGIIWKGKLSVSDSEALGIECEDTAEGAAWPYYGGGRITKLTTSNCKSIQACESSISIEALGLPWNTELVSEGADQDRIVGTGNGTPGFKLSCTVLGSKVTEECTGAIRAEATNGVGGVSAVFDDPEKLTCTEPGYKGKLAASLTGTQLITSAGTLEL